MTRQHFRNEPEDFVSDALAGFERMQASILRWNTDPSFIIRRDIPANKVGVLSGGGSGHEPMHPGFVGTGMLDAAVPGGIFASPAVSAIEAATVAVNRGCGVIYIVKNYTGDVLNFGLAAERATRLGIEVERVIVDDDLATDGHEDGPGRRGTAATIVVEKVCGALAERGAAIGEVARAGRRIASAARTMSVALHPGTHPGEERPSFDLGVGEIEVGVGIHGERGIDRRPFAPAAELARLLVLPLVAATDVRSGDAVLVIVNGLGSTHLLELAIMFGETARILDECGVLVARSLVGSYVTSLDMGGCSVTLIPADEELLELWDAPVHTAALRW